VDMTGRERLLKSFRQEAVDRVPVAPFIHVNFVKEFFNADTIDIIEKTIEVYEHFGFDMIHRNCMSVYYDDIDLSGPGWQVQRQTKTDGRNETRATVIHTPGGDLTETFKLNWMSRYDAEASVMEYFIKTEKDFDIFCKHQPPLGTVDTSDITKAKKLVCDSSKGMIAPWIQGAFNYLAIHYRKLDDLLMDAMINPTFYNRMMEYFLERNKQIITRYIEAGVDAFSYAGNIASGKLIGIDFFNEHVLPYEKRLIDFIKSKGVYVLYHNCGYGMKLFPAYRNLGMNVYESLTPPPFGDTILEKAFEIMPATITLSGNIDQIEFLKAANPIAIRKRVKEVLEKSKNRGNFILSTTDYFGEQTPYENIFTFAKAGRDFGRY
jgi:uroporphyrinogen decarboxylase